MKNLFLSVLTIFFLGATPLAAEELGSLPIITLADTINALEDRCPCVDIIESDEEERREDESPLDELEDLSNGVCKAKISNPGKFRQAFRYFRSLGLLQLEEDETLKDISSIFREGRNDCKGNSKSNSRR